MRPVAILFILAGALTFAACQGPSSKAGQPECICGTHDARLHGCPAPACQSGEGDADNPQCRCAALTPAGAAAGGK